MMKRQRTTDHNSQTERALQMLTAKGMVRRHEFVSASIAPETLARLVRKRQLTRVARGLYQKANAKPSAQHCLAEVAKLVPLGVICLISALQFHRLTSEVPAMVWVAIPNSSWRPTLRYPPVHAVNFGPAAYATSIEIHRVERVPVQIYGVAKTIVDCFRYRNKIGPKIAADALRTALADRRCSAHEIIELAERLRVAQVVRTYLEAVAT